MAEKLRDPESGGAVAFPLWSGEIEDHFTGAFHRGGKLSALDTLGEEKGLKVIEKIGVPGRLLAEAPFQIACAATLNHPAQRDVGHFPPLLALDVQEILLHGVDIRRPEGLMFAFAIAAIQPPLAEANALT